MIKRMNRADFRLWLARTKAAYKARRIKRAVLAAWWASRNADRLTMLRHELEQDGQEKGLPKTAIRALWYMRYLGDLPIR